MFRHAWFFPGRDNWADLPIIRSKTADVYNGLKLDSEEDWARIERAVGFLVEASFQRAEAPAKRTGKPPKRRTR